MNPGYRIEVFWSDEDEVWIADVPDLVFVAPEHLDPVTRIHRSSSNDKLYRRTRPITCLTW